MPHDLTAPEAIRLPHDHGERAAALTEIGRSMLVEAGAGTGKTSIMAGRVVMLMAAGIAPEAIVAISYTEVSASELLDRIVRFTSAVIDGCPPPDLLPAWPDGKPTAEQVAALKRARASLDRLCCMTIHGFCRTLLTPYPVEAGIDPGAVVMDQPSADLLFDEVSKAWLRRRLAGLQHDGDAFVGLYITDEKETRRLLDLCAQHMRANRGMTVPPCEPLTAEMAALRDAVAAFRAFLIAECAMCCPERIAAIVGELEEQVSSMPDTTADIALAWAVSLRVPSACATDKDEFNAASRACTKTMWKEAGVGRFSKAAIEILHGHAVTLYVAVRDAHEALRTAASGRALHIIAGQAATLLEQFSEAKRQAALLDFNDLIERTRLLLVNRPEVRAALNSRIKAVLVDEFQDTDPQQAEILWRLCGEPPEDGADVPWDQWVLRPGSLFVVGDPKQAIYRFRGGDLATYQRAAEMMARDPSASIVRISRNFRSRACILDAVNTWFEPVFTGQGGQAGFTALATDEPDLLETHGVARLDLEETEVGAERPTRDLEADLVAGVCRRLVGNLIVRRADGSIGPCEPSDIALLTPSGRDLWRYERALEEAELAVAPQAGKGFFRRQEVQDLIALARTLADSRDRLALGALLRGPLVGVPDRVLLDAVESQPVAPGHMPRISLSMEADLIADPVLREAIVRLQALARMRRGMTPHLLMARAVDEMRVRPILRQRGGRVAERALANVDLFLEMARPFDLRGIKAFADSMRAQWEEAQRSLDARPDMDRRSVSLMTMHSAKGLEWPVVIVVNTAGRINAPVHVGSDRPTNLFYVKAFGRYPIGCQAAHSEEKRQGDLERERLWWVATTRARDLLLMPDHRHRLTAPSWIKAVTFPLDGLEPFAHAHFARRELDLLPGGENGQDEVTFAAEARVVQASIPRITRFTPSRHEGDGDEAPAISVVPVAGEAVTTAIAGAGRLRGIVLHKLLEEVLNGGLNDTATELVERGRTLLKQLGIKMTNGPDPDEMAASVQRGLSVPEVSAVRGKLHAEWALATSATDDEGRESITAGVADAVAIEDDSSTSLVVDWKSDVEPTETTKGHYRGQLRSYLHAVGAPKGLLVFLTSGEIEAIFP